MVRAGKYEVGTRVVQLVSAQDEPLGEMDIFEAHRYPMHRHRAVSVWLFRRSPDGLVEVLWQQRSRLKAIGQLWGNTVCANNRPEEGYLECAQRRLAEELGAQVPKSVLTPLFQMEYRAFGNDAFGEHELDQVMVGWWSGELRPNPDEVSAVKWLRWSELLEHNVAVMSQVPSALESLSLTTKSELAAVAAARELHLVDDTGVAFSGSVAPWTLMMLKSGRVAEWVATAA